MPELWPVISEINHHLTPVMCQTMGTGPQYLHRNPAEHDSARAGPTTIATLVD